MDASDTTKSEQRPRPRQWALLFLLALLLRAWTVVLVESDPYLASPKSDSTFFIEWAVSIREQSFLGDRLFAQAPLYPYLLAGVMGLSDQPLTLMRILHVLLGSVTVLLITASAQLLTQDRRAALFAGVLAAVYGPFLYYTSLILKETLGLFLLSLFLWLALLGWQRPQKLRLWLFSGMAMGLFWLVRTNAPILALPVFVGLVWGRRWKSSVLFGLGMLLMILPLTLRNYLVTGQFTLTIASGGSNLYVGNNPQATGLYYTLPGVSADPRREAADLVHAAERMAGRPLSDSEASDFFVRKAVEYIVTQPLDWLRLMGKKALIFWNAFEVPDNYDYGFFARQIGFLAFLPQFWTIATLALAGLFLPTRDPMTRLLRWEVLAYMATVILFHVNGRFRVVILPLLLCGTAVLAKIVLDALQQRSRKTMLAAGFALLAAFLLTQTSVCDAERARVEAFAGARYAQFLVEEGRLTEAQQILQHSYSVNPNDAYTNQGLAELAMHRRDFKAAAFHGLQGLRFGVEDPGIYQMITTALIADGQRLQAIDFLLQATVLEPEKPQPKLLLRGLGLSEAEIRQKQAKFKP